jgi:hypothetical protein
VPFAYSGRFYQVRDVTVLPRPVQSPRIPIWIGGQYPKAGPVRRAARWDGSCLFISTSYAPGAIAQRDWTGDDVHAFLGKVAELRPTGLGGFDMVAGGRERQADWDADRALIREVADAGATWWTEWIEPTDCATTKAAISRGPLRD